MIIKNEYNEFIIVSIDYIRLFGKDDYIELYRKHIIYIVDGNKDIEGVEIPVDGYKFLRIDFINVLSNDLSYFAHTLHNENCTIGQESHNLLKVLKRAIKIHKLNNDK